MKINNKIYNSVKFPSYLSASNISINKNLQRYSLIRDVSYPWYFTPMSTNSSIVNKVPGIPPLGPYMPLGMTFPHPSMTQTKNTIASYYPLRNVSAPCYDTYISINSSNIENNCKVFPPYGKIFPLVWHTHIHQCLKYGNIARYYPLSVIASPWSDTPMSINSSNIEKNSKGFPPYVCTFPLGLNSYAHQCLKHNKIERGYPLRDIYSPWVDTSTSINASNIWKLKSITPLIP